MKKQNLDMKIDFFSGPIFADEAVLCTGCWDKSEHNLNANNDIEAGEPIYYRLASVEYNEWDAYCQDCAIEANESL